MNGQELRDTYTFFTTHDNTQVNQKLIAWHQLHEKGLIKLIYTKFLGLNWWNLPAREQERHYLFDIHISMLIVVRFVGIWEHNKKTECVFRMTLRKTSSLTLNEDQHDLGSTMAVHLSF